MRNKLGGGFLLASVALQNLGRREARTLLLLAAVAICSGAVFTGVVLMRSIESSMAVGFTRLGADMLVVPAGALTNITAALLTAEPTDLTLDDSVLKRLEAIRGVQKAAPQLVFRTDASGYRGGGDSIDVIAFDPERDFTVQPWLQQHLNRPIRKGDVILGGRREDALGAELLLFGWPLTVYGKLGKTGVGTHERALFMTFETLAAMRLTMQQICGAKAPLEPNKLSGALLQLAPGATTQQVRFAVLANFPNVKLVSGESMLTSIRQGLGHYSTARSRSWPSCSSAPC
jgi:putative ABC transport system permease protein